MVTSFSAYSGSEFLFFYSVMLVTALVASIWLPNILRSDGKHGMVNDHLQLAWLAAGPGRFTEAVLARLMGTGALAEAGDNKLHILRPDAGTNPAERALLASGEVLGISRAHRILKPFGRETAGTLEDRGLILDSGSRWALRFASLLPFIVVATIGWYRRQAGEALGEPTGFLSILIVLTLVIAAIRMVKVDTRTRAGRDAVASAREQSGRLKSAPTDSELGLGVALFGTAILAGTPYAQLHAMRQQATTDASGGYSSDSGGSSDGGGDGGCGGCGG